MYLLFLIVLGYIDRYPQQFLQLSVPIIALVLNRKRMDTMKFIKTGLIMKEIIIDRKIFIQNWIKMQYKSKELVKFIHQKSTYLDIFNTLLTINNDLSQQMALFFPSNIYTGMNNYLNLVNSNINSVKSRVQALGLPWFVTVSKLLQMDVLLWKSAVFNYNFIDEVRSTKFKEYMITPEYYDEPDKDKALLYLLDDICHNKSSYGNNYYNSYHNNTNNKPGSHKANVKQQNAARFNTLKELLPPDSIKYKGPSKSNPNNMVGPCFNYHLSGKCKFDKKCRFTHVCWCKGLHAVIKCTKNSNKPE